MVEQAEEIQTRKRYYVTTAIDYSNGEPHIGHSLEKVVADIVARYHRLQGHDTCLSMGRSCSVGSCNGSAAVPAHG